MTANATPNGKQNTMINSELIHHRARGIVKSYRKAANWLNAVQAHIDSLPKNANGHPDFSRWRGATVPYPSLRRKPSESHTGWGYDDARVVQRALELDVPEGMRGTLAEMRWTAQRAQDLLGGIHGDLFRSLPPLPRR